ncbi:hypothetical protein V3C99_016092 [Haemonchus contortus]
MWRLFLTALPVAFASESTFYYQNPSYLQFVVATLNVSVAPCLLQDVVKTAVVDTGSFTATPLLWIISVLSLAYSRHRFRMVLVEKMRYAAQSFVKDWFEGQQQEEKDRGVHEIDGTVRDRDFVYDDVKISKDDFKTLCRNLSVETQHRFQCFSDVIYVSRAIFLLTAVLSLIVCFIGSFVLVARTVNNEVNIEHVRVTLYDVIDNIVYISIQYGVAPDHKTPKLCSATFDVTIPLLDARRKELVNLIASSLLSGENDAVTRFTSMFLVMAGFASMFQLWLVAYKKSVIRRPSATLTSDLRQICILVTDRHSQVFSFLVPISIIACVIMEMFVHRFRNNLRIW